MSPRVLLAAVASLGLLAVSAPGPADAAAPAAQIVGPVSVNDSNFLAREGLVARDSPSPRLVRVPRLQGYLIAPSRFPGNGATGLFLIGRYSWAYRGTRIGDLAPVGFSPYLRERDGVRILTTSDQGLVAAPDPELLGGIYGLGPDLGLRWRQQEVPLQPGAPVAANGPVALAKDDILYALGGVPSVLDARTGRVIARLQDPPSQLQSPVVAPDGSLRAIASARGGVGDIAIVAYAPDGRLLWRFPLSPSSSASETSAPTVGPDGTTYVASWGSTPSGPLPVVLFGSAITAITPAGAGRWRATFDRRLARPVVDALGLIWSGVPRGGEVFALDASGAVAFRRAVGSYTEIQRLDGGVLVRAARGDIRLVGRPAKATPRAAQLEAATSAVAAVRPVRCLSPASGRPKTCIYPLTTRLPLTVTAPVDGRVSIRVRADGSRRVISRQGPYDVFAGRSRIWLDLRVQELCRGSAVATCYLPAGHYRASVSVPMAKKRSALLSVPFRVRSSAGTFID